MQHRYLEMFKLVFQLYNHQEVAEYGQIDVLSHTPTHNFLQQNSQSWQVVLFLKEQFQVNRSQSLSSSLLVDLEHDTKHGHVVGVPSLAQLIEDGVLQQGKALGELSLLQQYGDKQFFDQEKTIQFSDKVTALFTTQQWPLSILRGMGLGLMDISPLLKEQFISHAAGMHDGAASVNAFVSTATEGLKV